MAAFVNEYVVLRAIPIPKLLYVFGVCLVSASLSIPRSSHGARSRRIPDHIVAVQGAQEQAAQDADVLPARGALPGVRVGPPRAAYSFTHNHPHVVPTDWRIASGSRPTKRSTTWSI